MTAATLHGPAGTGRPWLRGLPWVTWRQHRVALAATASLLGAFALLMLLNGRAMHSAYADVGLSHCGNPNSRSCQVPLDLFSKRFLGWAQFLPRFLTFLPGVIGVFVGAPLVARELESGTFRFAWTQGRSRGQWVAVKMALLGTALGVLALSFSLVFTWWFGPWHSIMGRMSGGQAYEIEGVVFTARTVFGFALGALLGAVIRRTVPAMAATAAGWLAVAWPSVLYLRPRIMAPIVAPDGPSVGVGKAWTINSWVQDAAGHHLGQDALNSLALRARSSGVASSDAFDTWLAQRHYAWWVSYQPDGRFWHFQVVEAAGYSALALVLATATVWWVRRRAV